MRYIFYLLIALAIYGCTYHSQSEEPKTPVSYKETPYRSSNSIGLLRRLVIMPVAHEPYKDEYTSVKEQEAAAQSFQKVCADFLTDIKGYEILTIKDVGGEWDWDRIGYNNNAESPESSNLNNLYQQWHEETAGKHTEQVIQKIGRTLNADGVVVMWVKEREAWDAIDGILNIAFMNAPLFYNLGYPNIGAWIYETSSGQLVWSAKHSTFGEVEGTSTSNMNHVVNLFVNMENAVPSQLTK